MLSKISKAKDLFIWLKSLAPSQSTFVSLQPKAHSDSTDEFSISLRTKVLSAAIGLVVSIRTKYNVQFDVHFTLLPSANRLLKYRIIPLIQKLTICCIAYNVLYGFVTTLLRKQFAANYVFMIVDNHLDKSSLSLLSALCVSNRTRLYLYFYLRLCSLKSQTEPHKSIPQT